MNSPLTDLIDHWRLILLALALFSLAVGIVRFRQIRGDARRCERAVASWEQRRVEKQRDKNEASLVRVVENCFPFAAEAVKTRLRAGEGPTEAARNALHEIPGIPIGKTRRGAIPVPISLASRPTHLVAFGRTGTGKSTLYENLFTADAQGDPGLVALTAEAEAARDHLLPRVPLERDTVYIAVADSRCPILWSLLELEPGDPPERAVGEFFAAFKRSLRAESLGPRTDAIARNAFAALIGLPGTTLLSIRQLLEDEHFREGIVAQLKDENCRSFWLHTYPSYPPAAKLPILTRIESFTANPAVRRVLCSPRSTWSLREALAKKKVIIFDLSGLPPDDVLLLGQLILAKLQLEIMHRESVPESERPLTIVYLDEFHEVSAGAGGEGTFRQLFSKGRRYRVSINAFTQHPNQLSRSLQDEIFGNVATLICLAVGAKDASRLKKELLVLGPDGVRVQVDADLLQTQAVGEAVVRLGTGSCAVPVVLSPPLPPASIEHGTRVREQSWKRYGAPPESIASAKAPTASIFVAAQANRSANGPLPGRGGPQHKMLQSWAKKLAEERSFRVNLEQDVLDGAGRVDLVLTRDPIRVAVEISVSSTASEVAETVNKCAAAGFDHVVVVATSDAALKKAEQRTSEVIPAKDRTKIHFTTPDGLKTYLDALPSPARAGDLTAGYKVTVKAPPPEQRPNREAIARLVGAALLARRIRS